MLCLLEANSIPAFVHNGGLGGLLPGPQINGYNDRRIMVPSEVAERAQVALAVLAAPTKEPSVAAKSSFLEKLRVILEFFFLGWFIPSRQLRNTSRNHTDGDDAT